MTPLLEDALSSVIASLESGVAPWRKPWSSGKIPSLPLRSTGDAFSGMNAVLLSSLQAVRGYESPFWLTFNQAQDAGGHVRKGERAAPAILYKTRCVDGDARDGSDDKVLRFLKSYGVFNACQIEGLPDSFYPAPDVEMPDGGAPLNDEVLAIMQNFPVPVSHGGDVACYYIMSDRISMPPRSTFESDEDYVAVLLHEFGHATGSKHRLDRFEPNETRADYAREELVAELTSHLTSMYLGINPSRSVFANHVAYLGHWAGFLKEKPAELLRAAGKAQAAADMILSYRTATAKFDEPNLSEAA
jgi:antirestriction protein ArdC